MFKTFYLKGPLSQGFVALLSGRLIQVIAYGLIGIFLPIFLFEKLGASITNVLWYFGAGWLLYVIFLPLGAQLINKIGLRRSIRISVIIEAFFFACLYFWDASPYFFIYLSIVLTTINKLLFWIPYHTDFAQFTDRKNRGKEYSLLMAASTIMEVGLPLIAGFLIAKHGFNFVFVLAFALILTTYIPFLMLPKTREKFSWRYVETWTNLIDPKNRGMVLAHIASGAENIVGILIWPIFIWLILKGEYLQVGAISTIITAGTVIMQLSVGRWTDEFSKKKLLKWGSMFYSLGWILKMIIDTAFQIFLAGLYHSFSAILMRTPFDSLTYQIAADQGHLIDEFTVIKEMAVQIGRITMIILLTVILLFASIKWAFVLAALMSLAFNFIPEKEFLEARNVKVAS